MQTAVHVITTASLIALLRDEAALVRAEPLITRWSSKGLRQGRQALRIGAAAASVAQPAIERFSGFRRAPWFRTMIASVERAIARPFAAFPARDLPQAGAGSSTQLLRL